MLTTDVDEILGDPSIAIVAEVMGGVEPTGELVLQALRSGKHVVTANKQLVAQRGAELFDAASGAGVQLRFEASVCAAIPVIKVLRESLVVTNVHRVLGIVNGTTNFMLTRDGGGRHLRGGAARGAGARLRRGRPDRRRLGCGRGREDGDPRYRRLQLALHLADVEMVGIDTITPLDVAAARELDMVIRLVGMARLLDGKVDIRVGPALVDRHHPLAAVEGAFNAVMLQGDAIREITLEGPGAGGVETASAVIADMASVIGTMGTGFLQNDPVWRNLPRLEQRREPLAVLLPPHGRRPARRAGARRGRARRARGVGRTAAAAPERRRRGAPRRHARHAPGRAGRRARGDHGDGRGARASRCPSPSSPSAGLRGSDGRDRAVQDRLPVVRRDARRHARRGLDAADPLAAHRRAARDRAALQVRGHEPDRVVQGPRHDRRRLEGGRGGRRGGRLRVDGEYGLLGGGLRGARRPDRGDPLPGRSGRRGEARAVACRRRARCSRCRGASTRRSRAASSSPTAARTRSSTRSTRTGSRGRRRPRSRSTRRSAAAPDVLALPYGGGGNTVAYAKGFAEDGRAAADDLGARRRPGDDARLGDPHRRAGPPRRGGGARRRRHGRAGRGHRRGHHANVARARQSEGIFCEPSSAAGVAALVEKLPLERGSTVVCVLTGHGLKDAARGGRLHPGCGARRPERRVDPRGARARFEQAQPRAGMNFVVRAPATSANLGPGFDCAGAALDLWNELHVLPADEGEPLVEVEGVGADEIPHDETHLALRAFALAAPARGHRFRFVNRIPLESGLGSSAATVAAGLVAGRVAAERRGRRPARARPAARGPRRQPRACAARRRLPDLARRRAVRGAPDRDRAAARRRRGRPGGAREHEGVAGAPARVASALGGCDRRGAGRAARRRRSPRATPSCSPPRSTTACTSPSGSPTRPCSRSCARACRRAPPASRSRARAPRSSSGRRRVVRPTSPTRSVPAASMQLSCPIAIAAGGAHAMHERLYATH